MVVRVYRDAEGEAVVLLGIKYGHIAYKTAAGQGNGIALHVVEAGKNIRFVPLDHGGNGLFGRIIPPLILGAKCIVPYSH